MDWLLFGGLGIVWAAYLLPSYRRRARAHSTVEEFERGMGLLAETEQRTAGRWIVAPRKGEPFIGNRERARARARARRRRIFVFLLEVLGLTFLIGVFPPLRGMWILTAVLAAVLGAYLWMLVALKERERRRPARPVREPSVAEYRRAVEARHRVVAHPTVSEDDRVHVTVYNSNDHDLDALRRSIARVELQAANA